jgi:peptidoglycan/LPS O-acetylase OafA/YrhL
MQPPKLGFIDSLRGFAALYVLLFHFSLITTPMAVAPRWLAPFTGLGGSGVTLFFIVSAFTLCLSMDSRNQDESTPLINYYLRRFFRIAPLFYIWIALYFIRDIVIFNVIHPPAEVARSVLFLLNLSPGNEQGFVWASWTIGVEMLFYVFFPAIFRFTGNIGRATAFFIIALLMRSLWQVATLHFISDQTVADTYYNLSLLHHLPTFALGIVIYRVYRLLNFDRSNAYGLGESLVIAASAALVSLAYGFFQTGSWDGLTVESLIYGALLVGLAIKAPAVLVNRLTRFYGKISYSVYLSHATTLYLMSKIFATIYAHVASVTLAYLMSLSVGLIVVTVLSWLTYRFIETPGNNLGKAVIRALQRRRASSLVA